ncbi:FMN-binding protein [Pilimelia terevasa]|uniref:FMN-binding protein n=1 Tax=Pilimelia terevasa TaxID=53372 RepID=A0A8J3BPY1_9ACTN|nr:FMN-binding protein [Pilimelia terevasa]GGK38985.1 FMN-binding protein [Pilimelia terevasa]
MRRTTAAVIGTVAGAAMLLGVRLTAAPVALAGNEPVAAGAPEPAAPDDRQRDDRRGDSQGGDRAGGGGGGGGRDGTFRGDAVTNPYGTVRVSVTVEDGKITAADASYPTDGNSGTVNGNAIPRLREATLQAQSARIDAVSGATYTSAGYRRSLQSALDDAGL